MLAEQKPGVIDAIMKSVPYKFTENGKPSEAALQQFGVRAWSLLAIADMQQKGIDPGATAAALIDSLVSVVDPIKADLMDAQVEPALDKIPEPIHNPMIPWAGKNSLVDARLPTTRGEFAQRNFNHRQVHRGPGRYSAKNELRRQIAIARSGTIFKSR